ncbi:MAG: FAD-dependent oxidoreductase, partial [Syntrophomonadaceae bacterium]|nr:FAD-dependent oxidoreductase [Syntrophomonadaceae bacterium]
MPSGRPKGSGASLASTAITTVSPSHNCIESRQATDGSTIPADLVLFSIGVTPNVELAREAGLEVNRGIIVNQNMQTSTSGILAAGDVVEYDGKVNGLWSLALEQGRIAGANAVDDRQTY